MSNKELDDIALAEAKENSERQNRQDEALTTLRGCGCGIVLMLGFLLVIADIIFVHSALAWLLL